MTAWSSSPAPQPLRQSAYLRRASPRRPQPASDSTRASSASTSTGCARRSPRSASSTSIGSTADGDEPLMRIAVFGLGEAGSAIGADLATAGAEVHGYDPAPV